MSSCSKVFNNYESGSQASERNEGDTSMKSPNLHWVCLGSNVMYSGLEHGSSPEFSDNSDNGFADSEEPNNDPEHCDYKSSKKVRKQRKDGIDRNRPPSQRSSRSIYSFMFKSSPFKSYSNALPTGPDYVRSSYPPTAPCNPHIPDLQASATRYRRGSAGDIIEKKKYAFTTLRNSPQTLNRTHLPSISSSSSNNHSKSPSQAKELLNLKSYYKSKIRFRETSETSTKQRFFDEYDVDLIPQRISPTKTSKQVATVTNNRDKTDLEFMEFARDFALACSRKPMFDLLTENQYVWYRHKNVTPGSLLTNNQYAHSCQQPKSNDLTANSYYRTQNPPECMTPQPDGHVVGDILAFITNTMRYFDNPDLSDVILVVGEHRFYSHKFALASQSDVFRDMMIVSDRCTGCPDFQKELELEESKDCQKVFGQFLRFFYCGKISFTSDTALPLLVLAAKYKVEALRSACDAFIANMIEDGDLKSAIKWLKYATRYHLNDLSVKCVDGAISDNIEELIESSEWPLLPVECMEAILFSSCLLVPDEYFIFEALQRWVMARRKTISDDEISEDLKRVLPNIRFSQMQSAQLLAVEESPLGLHWRPVLRSYLGDAYRYQILARECPEFQDPQYLPRDYTDKQWCSTLHFNPTRNKRTSPSVTYDNGRWEVQPRRYYDTINVVIILKKPLLHDIKVCISILIFKRSGDIQMRLRRKACVLRAGDLSPRGQGPKPGESNTNMSPRSIASFHGGNVGNGNLVTSVNKQQAQSTSRLHGPNNGQEYYAIDNIISDTDFQMAMSQAGPAGIKIGVIIRTWNI